MKNIKAINQWIVIQLLTVLLACIFFLNIATPVLAVGAEKVKLTSSDTVAGTPFSVENMFPGDSVVKEYIVSVSPKKANTLDDHADIRAGYEILAEVLKTKIELADKGVTLYDGLMRDMPAALEYPLAAGENTLCYRITVYLDPSVGEPNELDPDGKRYMNRELIADFRWWYLDEPAPVSVKLTAEKTLNGKHPQKEVFTFLLSDGQGNILQTKRNKGGLVEFDSLRFTEPGDYIFYLTEKNEGKKKVYYDDAVYCIIVEVEEQNGILTASVSYLKDGKSYAGTPHFANFGHPIPGTEGYLPLWLLSGLFGGVLLILGLIVVLNKRKKGWN